MKRESLKSSMEWIDPHGWIFQNKSYEWHGIRLESRGPVLSESFIYQSSARSWLGTEEVPLQEICVIVEDFEPYYGFDAKHKFKLPSHMKTVLLECLEHVATDSPDDDDDDDECVKAGHHVCGPKKED